MSAVFWAIFPVFSLIVPVMLLILSELSLILPALALILPALSLIFAVLPEMDKMSITFSDFGGSPRNLFNFLINPGIFFPSTFVAKEKTSSETAK